MALGETNEMRVQNQDGSTAVFRISEIDFRPFDAFAKAALDENGR